MTDKNITISLGLVHTKNNSTQRLKLKPKTLTFPLSADGRTDGRTDRRTDGRQNRYYIGSHTAKAARQKITNYVKI